MEHQLLILSKLSKTPEFLFLTVEQQVSGTHRQELNKTVYIICLVDSNCSININSHSCFSSVQFSSVAQSCTTLCDPMNHSTPGLPVHHDPMNHSTPGLPVHHQLPEFTQTQVHQVGDAIQPSHPLLSPSLPASLIPCPQSLPASESFPMSQLFA